MEGDRGGGVCCLLEVAEACSCQVNVLQCTLVGIETIILLGKYIRWKSVRGKKLYLYYLWEVNIYVYLCWWLDPVWLCPGKKYWLGLVSQRLLVILYMVVSLASALFCSRVGQERAEAKVDPDVSQL